MELEGKIILIGETESLGKADKPFLKRQLVIETDEKYPQKVAIDFTGDKTGIIDDCFEGQDVRVHINVRGNEYKGKYYVNLVGWRVENLNTAQQAAKPASPQKPLAPEDESDPLPF